MNTGNKKASKKSHKNKEAIQFVLANRELDDPNINNPNVPTKILLQVNKGQELTSKQKEILNQIPKECLGVYDEEAKLKKLLASEAMKKVKGNEDITEGDIANQLADKRVRFDFAKSEVIPFDKKAKIQGEADKSKQEGLKKEEGVDQEDEGIEASSKENDPSSNETGENINDNKYIDELFKRVKVNAKIVEYNEFGLEKNMDPALLEFVTNKEFREGIDIFIPPLRPNELEFNKFHTDIKPEDMNEDYKEVDAELQSDPEEDKAKEETDEQIDTSSKAKKALVTVSKGNELEDDFILLANEGQLPVEFIDKPTEEEEVMPKAKQETQGKPVKTPAYKFISKEEIEFVNKKFEKELKGDKPQAKSEKSKKKKATKEEFDEAVEEMLRYKRDNKKDYQKPKVFGLTQKYEDEGEYEEYESLDEEDMKNDGLNAEEEYEEEEDDEEYEEIKEEKDNEQKKKAKLTEIDANNNDSKPKTIIINGKPITIEYMDKTEEAEPFSKEDKPKQNKKEKRKRKEDNPISRDDHHKKGKEEEEEEFTKEDLEKLVTNKDIIEKTLELFNYHEDNENEQDQKIIDAELDKKFIHEPKRRIDITSAKGKIVNLPKTINDLPKKVKNESKAQPKEEEKEIANPRGNNLNQPIDIQSETKEQKKLRKQLVKLERKEKRKENKKVKNAFKEEKKSQSHQIAETNKVLPYGLSIKEI